MMVYTLKVSKKWRPYATAHSAVRLCGGALRIGGDAFILSESSLPPSPDRLVGRRRVMRDQLASGRWLRVVRMEASSCEPNGFDRRGRLCAALLGKSA